MNETYDNQPLQNAVKSLLALCDGAGIIDGMGYNRFDAKYARSLSSSENWSRRMDVSAYKMIQKYSAQLTGLGINIGDIADPASAKASAIEKPKENYRRAKIKDDRIYIDFKLPRDEWGAELSRVRNLPGREFHNDVKEWSAPINRYIIEKLQDWCFDFDDELKKHEKELCDTVLPELEMPKGLSLFPFQEEGVKRLEKLKGKALLSDEMGCLDGEAIVSINRGGATKKIKLKNAYLRFNGLAERKTSNWDKSIITNTRSVDLRENRIRLNEIEAIIYKGKKEVLMIKTESGKELKLTSDHELMVGLSSLSSEWKETGDLKPGDYIFVNGKTICKSCGSDENIITYKHAKFLGYCKKCMYKKLRFNHNQIESKKHKHRDGYIYLRGQKYINHPRYSTNGLLEHVYIMEKRIGRPIREDEEIHHKNEIKDDNRPENLELLNKSEHRRKHKTEAHFKSFTHKSGSTVMTVPFRDKIIEIKKAETIDVYDIVCADPNRNFIANGIVVHNCGKTVQVLMYAKIHPELRPMLIVVPATLKINWSREITKWGVSGKVQILSGRDAYVDKSCDITIINYDILSDNLDKLVDINFKLLIADEIHLCKNTKTKRTKAFKYLSKKIKHIICISGTPIINRPLEFWPTLNTLCPEIFNNFYRYTQKFCGAEHNGYGWQNKGSSNTDELNDILVKSIMIRRLKKDVMKDLPPKLRSIIPMEITNREEYDFAEKDLIAYINSTQGYEKAQKASNAEILVKFGTLKKLAVLGKMKQINEWVENFIAGNKLVLGCTHHFSIDMLYERFKKIAVKLDGRDSPRKKQEAVDRFQNDDNIKLFLGNIKAAGVGITLTAASNVGFIECPWTPGECDQFEDRCHRIGTIADCVNAWYLVGLNTIEESIVELIDQKRKVVMAVLDGEEPEDSSLVSELIKQFKETI